MSRRNIIILSILASIIIFGGVLFWIGHIHEPKIESEEIKENKINKVEIISENTINTSAKKDVVLPKAKLIMKQYYEKCGHTIESQYSVPEAIVNMTENQVNKYYTDWELTDFSPEQIVISKKINKMCDEHFIVRENDGHISIYNITENGEEQFLKNTDILTKYLSDDDKENLKNGVRLVGKTELSSFLEDFE